MHTNNTRYMLRKTFTTSLGEDLLTRRATPPPD